MKKLLFSLAFMLIGSFAFASNIEVKEDISKEIIEVVDLQKSTSDITISESVNVQETTGDWNCFIFNDSCGGSWIVCHRNVSALQLSQFLFAWDGGC